MSDDRYSDEQLEQAIDALTEPDRFNEAEARVARMAPALQRVLGEALASGGWFGEAHDSQLRQALGDAADPERVNALRTLLAEETRLGMLVGVAVGWELARELEGTESGDGG